MMRSIEALVCRATGARAVRFDAPLQSLWSGYGEIRRAHLHGAAAETVVVKWVRPPVEPAGERAVAHRRKLRSYAVEQGWYERFAERCPPEARVPRYHGGFRLSDGWLFVLEDLDAAGFSGRRFDGRRDDVLACLHWLAAFHGTFMGSAPDGLWEEGTYWHWGTRTEEARHIADPRLRAHASRYDAHLRRAPYRTLVHGDAKIENFCFGRDGVAALDFQYVGGGCGMRDVVYLLWGCLDAATLDGRAEHALAVYFEALHEALRRSHPDIDAAAVEAAWRAHYPVAWADFVRFLAGWDPRYRPHAYDRRMLAAADAIVRGRS